EEVLFLGVLVGLLGAVESDFGGRDFLQNCRQMPVLRTRRKWMNGSKNYYPRSGVAGLLDQRFCRPLRPMLPWFACMCDMPLPRFVAVSVLAAAGWSIAYLMPGWAAGAAIRPPLPEGFWPEAAVVGGSPAVLFGLSLQRPSRPTRSATRLLPAARLVLAAAPFFGLPSLADCAT
ncbi:phosphoesterase, partial [Pseudomonas syringae]